MTPRRLDSGTVMFIDLVRFTSLTDIHGDVAAADAADALAGIARDALVDGTELIKLLGDGVLLIADRPARGLRAVVAIIRELHERSNGLDARGGLHHGPVVWRGEDVFGAAVNLSARLAALAEPGMLVVTRAVAVHAGELDLEVTPLGDRPVRGLQTPIEMFQIDPCSQNFDSVIDPVCGMRLRRLDAIGTSGRIGFCSRHCQDLSLAHPELYR